MLTANRPASLDGAGGEQVRADSRRVDAAPFKLDAERKSSAPALPGQLPKKAKVKRFGTSRLEYDFGQSITHEQAAEVIFVDGKVPRGFKLQAGPGANGWTLRADDPEDLNAWQAMVNKMKARTQEVDTTDVSEVEEDWSGTKKPDAKKPGFWVNKRFNLDVGQIPERLIRHRLHESGAVGYEVIFDTPVDEKEVMVKLFIKSAPWDQIQLLPMGGSPTTFWIIHLIGIEAHASFNRTAISVFAWDPKTKIKDSTAPGVPEAMRKHLEGKTVPKDAKKHPPNVYVWEADGHLAYVETDAPNGGGKLYKYETTKISHAGKGDQEYMRDLVLNQGMKPKEAWMQYEKEFLELVKSMGGSVDLNAPKLNVPSRGATASPRIKTSQGKNPKPSASASAKAPDKAPVKGPKVLKASAADPNSPKSGTSGKPTGEETGGTGEKPSAGSGSGTSTGAKGSKNRPPPRSIAEIDRQLGELDKVEQDILARGAEVIAPKGADPHKTRPLYPPNVVRARLREEANKGGVRGAQAQGILDELAPIDQERKTLKRERRDAHHVIHGRRNQ